jgi:RecA-family ATPase
MPSLRAMADTLSPCRFKSWIKTISPSVITCLPLPFRACRWGVSAAAVLWGVLASLRRDGVQAAVLALDGLQPKGDMSDWLRQGGDPDVLERAAEAVLAEEAATGFFSAADLYGRPVPATPWHVEGLVPSGTVTLLGGDGGTGKSLLAKQLACATALGRQWLGREVRRGPALFLSAEDDVDEIHRRLADIARAENVALADLHQLTIRSLAGSDALLALPSPAGTLAPSPLFHEIERRMAAEKPALVVLDTLADMFPGNENDRALARQFIGMLRGLAIRHRCAVVLLAHPSLTGLNSGTGTSGSTGWSNSVRSRLYLERVVQDGYEPNPDARLLSVKKANYSRTGAEIAVRWQDGVFIPEAVETGLDRMATGIKAERVFLKLLRQHAEQGRRVNAAGGTNYAPKVFAAHPDAEGCSKRALGQAMEALLGARKLRISHEGPPSRRVSYIEEADQ